MSIESKLTRLSVARNNTIISLSNKGIDATGHGFEDFPQDIDDINTDIVLINKQITENGTYDPQDDEANGYDLVNVNVCPGRLPTYVKDLGPNQYVYSGGTFKLNGTTVSYSDVYLVEEGTKYLLFLGSDVGSRFRAITTIEDTSTTTVDLVGKQIVYRNDPVTYDSIIFTSTMDGYLTITKDNAGKADIPTYLFDYNELIAGLST